MKNLIFTISTVLICLNSFSQKKYEVQFVGEKYTAEKIENAIEAAEWCGYYFQDERHIIKFDDGSIVEFKSGLELPILDSSCLSNKYVDDKIYSIHPSGRIFIEVKKKQGIKEYPTNR